MASSSTRLGLAHQGDRELGSRARDASFVLEDQNKNIFLEGEHAPFRSLAVARTQKFWARGSPRLPASL